MSHLRHLPVRCRPLRRTPSYPRRVLGATAITLLTACSGVEVDNEALVDAGSDEPVNVIDGGPADDHDNVIDGGPADDHFVKTDVTPPDDHSQIQDGLPADDQFTPIDVYPEHDDHQQASDGTPIDSAFAEDGGTEDADAGAKD